LAIADGKSIKKMHDPTGEGIKPTSKTVSLKVPSCMSNIYKVKSYATPYGIEFFLVQPKPRSKLWWQHHFQLYGLQESKEATERFESLLLKTKFKTSYYIFHLISTDIRR
jgi:hypothetical protein